MSKLDSLLSFADDLNSKSNTLISNLKQSNSLIDHIASLQDEISTADLAIDSMNNLLAQNTKFLQEFDNLYEKCFYLEANLHMNDDYTNQTSFEYLHHQYQYLLKLFKEKNKTWDHSHNDHTSYKYDIPQNTSEVDPIDQTPVTPSLSKTLSISNLKLKPIRCRSAKVSKKKSHYRLSSAYTLNPLAMDSSSRASTIYSPSFNQEHLANTEDATVIIHDTLGAKKHPKRQQQTPYVTPSRPIHNRYPSLNVPATENSSLNCMDSAAEQSTIATTTYDTHSCSRHVNRDDVNDNDGHLNVDDLETTSSSPLLYTNQSQPRVRANSLPETGLARDLFGELVTANADTNDDNATSNASVRAEEMRRLRHRRLHHFISYHNGFNHGKPHNHDSHDENYQATFGCADFENIEDVDDMEGESIYSDDSYNDASPFNESKRVEIEEFDNFDRFLRKSRLDLRNAFPNLHDKDFSLNESSKGIAASISCDSQCAPTPQLKFHNPVSSICSNPKSDFAKPTIESIYSQSQPDSMDNRPWDIRGHRNANKGSSAQLLSDVMLKDYERSVPHSPTKVSTPSGNTVLKFPTLFNILQSPHSKKTGSPSPSPTTKPPGNSRAHDKRRKSIDVIGKSLTETFKSLVNTNPSYVNMGPHGITTGFLSTSTSHDLSSSLPGSPNNGASWQRMRPPPPSKLTKLCNKDKHGPISISNDLQNKRLPPTPNVSTSTPQACCPKPPRRMHRTDGYHSQLTIGPRKTKIIDHGESSVFKRPLVSKVSHDSLRQALSESLI